MAFFMHVLIFCAVLYKMACPMCRAPFSASFEPHFLATSDLARQLGTDLTRFVVLTSQKFVFQRNTDNAEKRLRPKSRGERNLFEGPF